MKERPILFSAPMVQAILDGSKTQTRRVIKPPSGYRANELETAPDGGIIWIGTGKEGSYDKYTPPRYHVGDCLWVKETFRYEPEDYDAFGTNCPVQYRATHGECDGFYSKWRPSIFMPRQASRITIEITQVRAQRLQDISKEDCLAEGLSKKDWEDGAMLHGVDWPRFQFQKLWDSINDGRGHGWSTNPWIWAITFKRVRLASGAGLDGSRNAFPLLGAQSFKHQR